MIEIQLDGKPIPWAASRVRKGVHYNPRHIQKLEFQWQIRAQYRSDPIEGYYYINFKYFFQPPASVSKSKRRDMIAGVLAPTSQDTTNLNKFFEDCLKKIVITDDRYVRKICGEQLYADREGVLIQVFPWDEYKCMEHRKDLCQ